MIRKIDCSVFQLRVYKNPALPSDNNNNLLLSRWVSSHPVHAPFVRFAPGGLQSADGAVRTPKKCVLG